jgi:hypothetical protein
MRIIQNTHIVSAGRRQTFLLLNLKISIYTIYENVKDAALIGM